MSYEKQELIKPVDRNDEIQKALVNIIGYKLVREGKDIEDFMVDDLNEFIRHHDAKVQLFLDPNTNGRVRAFVERRYVVQPNGHEVLKFTAPKFVPFRKER